MGDQKQVDIEAQIKLQWNSKPSPGYKLKYYNYFSDRIDDQDFKLSNYVRLHESIFMPNLNFYQKFNEALHQNQLFKRSTLYYNPLLQSQDESQIITRRYNGFYAQQEDYWLFR
ncbi:hypothetical protein pb186bvf_007138 [Paramecium bursaria]